MASNQPVQYNITAKWIKECSQASLSHWHVTTLKSASIWCTKQVETSDTLRLLSLLSKSLSHNGPRPGQQYWYDSVANNKEHKHCHWEQWFCLTTECFIIPGGCKHLYSSELANANYPYLRHYQMLQKHNLPELIEYTNVLRPNIGNCLNYFCSFLPFQKHINNITI